MIRAWPRPDGRYWLECDTAEERWRLTDLDYRLGRGYSVRADQLDHADATPMDYSHPDDLPGFEALVREVFEESRPEPEPEPEPEPDDFVAAELLMALDEYEAQGMPPHLVKHLRDSVALHQQVRSLHGRALRFEPAVPWSSGRGATVPAAEFAAMRDLSRAHAMPVASPFVEPEFSPDPGPVEVAARNRGLADYLGPRLSSPRPAPAKSKSRRRPPR